MISPMRARPGTTCLRNSTRLAISESSPNIQTPVIWPPGLVMLLTRPKATGSSIIMKMSGIVVVALRAARIELSDPARITSGLSATKSEASSGRRATTPSAKRSSSETLRPSTYPRARRPSRKPSMLRFAAVGESADKTPISGRVAGCCACTAKGQAAALPTSVMNSRRLIRSTRRGTAASARPSGGGLHDVFDHVATDLTAHILAHEHREPVVETRPDAGVRYLVVIGPNVGPAMGNARRGRTGHADFGNIGGT